MKRIVIDKIAHIFFWLAGLFTLGVLIFIIGYVLKNGLPYLNFDFIFSMNEGSILPMIYTTFLVVVVSIAVATPIGIGTAIYLNEYAKENRFVKYLTLAIETLAGIPSIIYGLFGLLVFVRFFDLNQSIIAGAFTLAIMILPVIIRTTQESLKTVPNMYREGSYALGANKIQTIFRVVLPASINGILTAIILAIGRVVGESAPVLLTVGLVVGMPLSIFDSGRTLSVHLYMLTKEAINPDDFGIAFATATVLIVFVIFINIIAKIIAKKVKRGI